MWILCSVSLPPSYVFLFSFFGLACRLCWLPENQVHTCQIHLNPRPACFCLRRAPHEPHLTTAPAVCRTPFCADFVLPLAPRLSRLDPNRALPAGVSACSRRRRLPYMENISEGAAVADKNQSQLSAMLSSPSAGGRRIAGNYARGSPGEVYMQ